MRIVGGNDKGRPLAAPKGSATRPTSDRAREAIFNVLAHGIDGPALEGALVLDVFAGTGALGLEALSRGATHVTFVDNARAAVQTLKENVRTLGREAQCTILACSAGAIGSPTDAAAQQGAVDFAFFDAPYEQGLSEPALVHMAQKGWFRDGAVLMVEVGAREPFTPPPGFATLKEKTYGAARAVFLRYAP